MRINIAGAYHSPFGKLENETLYSLYEKAARGVLADAQLEAKDIDAVFVGNYSGGGFNNQENIASYGVNILPDLRFKPLFRVETACASGSSAIHMATMSILSGMMKRVMVVGLEKMTDVSNRKASEVLSYATYWPEEGERNVTAPCMFSQLARGWMKKCNYSEEQLRDWLAAISAKAYQNAAVNPLAQIRKARTKEDILNLPTEKNPVIDSPLCLHDCSLISDGSAAIILESEEMSTGKDNISIEGFYNAGDYLDLFGKNKADHFLEGAGFAVRKALEQAGMSISDIQMAEVHDCFTITELLMYSAIGLTAPGKEFQALENGSVMAGGECIINSSGGLKAKGHPIGATGVAMHAHIYKQLTGDPYGLNIANAEAGMVVNIGGSGTSNAVTILKHR
jgi:acetyl-CoA C-acetyltransferase